MLTLRSPARRRLALAWLALLGLVAGFLFVAAAQTPAAQAQAQRPAAYGLCPRNAKLRSTQTQPPAQFAAVIHVPDLTMPSSSDQLSARLY